MRRVVLGQRNSGEYGLWVSKPGRDVFSASVDDFLVHPSMLAAQPVASGQVTRLIAQSVGTNTWQPKAFVSHNLGFVPLVIVSSRLFDGQGNYVMYVTSSYFLVESIYTTTSATQPPDTDLTATSPSSILSYAIFAARLG